MRLRCRRLLSTILSIGGLLLAVGGAAPASDDAVALESILANHTAARGGAEAIEALQTIRLLVEVVEPGFTVIGDYRAAKDGRMRIDIFDGERRVFSEGIDAQGAWQQAGEGAAVAPVSDAGEAALRHGVEWNMYGLHRFEDRGHAIAYDGIESVGGIDYYVLRITMADGFESFALIDPATWQIARRRNVRALHPDMDPTQTTLETVFDDYQPHCGVLRAMTMRQVDLSSGDVVQRSRILKAACNEPIAALDLPRETPD